MKDLFSIKITCRCNTQGGFIHENLFIVTNNTDDNEYGIKSFSEKFRFVWALFSRVRVRVLKFWVHKQLAEQTFYKLGLMSLDHFRK